MSEVSSEEHSLIVEPKELKKFREQIRDIEREAEFQLKRAKKLMDGVSKMTINGEWVSVSQVNLQEGGLYIIRRPEYPERTMLAQWNHLGGWNVQLGHMPIGNYIEVMT